MQTSLLFEFSHCLDPPALRPTICGALYRTRFTRIADQSSSIGRFSTFFSYNCAIYPARKKTVASRRPRGPHPCVPLFGDGIFKLRCGKLVRSREGMGKLVFGMMQSLDGYVAGIAGGPELPPPRHRAPSLFQRSRPRPSRQFVRSSHVRGDALLGRGSAGVGRHRARLRGSVAGAAEMGRVTLAEVGWCATPRSSVTTSKRSCAG